MRKNFPLKKNTIFLCCFWYFLAHKQLVAIETEQICKSK